MDTLWDYSSLLQQSTVGICGGKGFTAGHWGSVRAVVLWGTLEVYEGRCLLEALNLCEVRGPYRALRAGPSLAISLRYPGLGFIVGSNGSGNSSTLERYPQMSQSDSLVNIMWTSVALSQSKLESVFCPLGAESFCAFVSCCSWCSRSP